MHVFLATNNRGKVQELRSLCEPAGWRIDTFEQYTEPVEGDTSYEENAALKATTLFEQLQRAGEPFDAVLADDSGIEVAALDGRPGVVSARYGGAAATWASRRRTLIEAVDAAAGTRAARFVCALHLIERSGRSWTARGVVNGTIAEVERGDGGFSYDAAFVYPPLERTFAELSAAQKNAISHRANAVRALLDDSPIHRVQEPYV